MSTNNNDIASLVSSGANDLSVSLPDNAIEAFQTYYELLKERGKGVNLTTVTGARDVAQLHFLDSISLLNVHSFEAASVIDIGSGAGFPGIPLKIAEPSITLTLLDSSGKRINFMSEVCESLNLDANCVLARAEDFAREEENREKQDIAVSRALAKLNILAELCLPLVRVGGAFIAMKGVESNEEIKNAKKSLDILGGKLVEYIDYNIPDTNIVHRAVVIEKTSETPIKYPRRFARIQKSPL